MKKPGILFVSLLCAVMFLMSCEKTIVTDTTPPAPVTELKAVSENGKIVLTWKDPSDSDLLGIKIYNGKEQARAVSLSDGVLVGKGIQKYEVMGLENEKIYTFKVSAVDKALNESKTVETGKIIFIEKTVKTVYVCPNCEKTYGTAKEAADCCGVKIIEKKVTHYAFVCPKCKEEYLSPQKAADCCGVQIEYVDREVEKIVKKYLCPRDGKEYDAAEEAENCCGPVEEEKLVYSSGTIEAGVYTVYHLQRKIGGGKSLSDYTLVDTEIDKNVTAEVTIAVLGNIYPGFTAKAMIQNESVIYVFYDRNTITYTFDTGSEGKFEDGTTSKTVSGLYGERVSLPDSPVSNDANFEGWAYSNQEVSETFGAENMTYTAQWNVISMLIAKSKEMIPVITESITITGDQTKGVFIKGRTVTLSPYSIGKYEITQVIYEDVMGINPSYFSNDSAEGEIQELRPVEKINWYRAIAFCNKLSLREGFELCYSVKDSKGIEIDWENIVHSDIPTTSNSLWNSAVCDRTKNGYRLPTEAEWEFAARGGNQNAEDWNFTYSGSNSIMNVAWYSSNSNTKTHKVGIKEANRLGIYDMNGNVMEWCNDWYGSNTNAAEIITDPVGPATGSYRVQRGGCYDDDDEYCALSYLSLVPPHSCSFYFGFRLARSIENVKEEQNIKNPTIGKIVMSDGTYIEAKNYSSYTGTAIPVGVVCKVNEDGQTGLMLGLCNSSSGTNSGLKKWASSSAIGYDANLIEIQGTQNGVDKDGSDNWAEICKVDTAGTTAPAINYPAFSYVLTYAETAGLTETEYEDGWYMPTIFELYNYIYQNNTVLNESLTAADGTTLLSNDYWSSSQYGSGHNYAFNANLNNGYVSYAYKTHEFYVCCLRTFGKIEKVLGNDYTKTTAEIGDIILNDGKFIASDNFPSFYIGTATPVGIVCKINDDGQTGLMLGLYNSSSGTNSGYKVWAKKGTTGYSTNFTAIQGTRTDGDTDGSNNWAEICKVDTKGTANPATNYPAFSYVLNYAETAGLKETEYADGWYMPTVYELYNYVYLNKTTLNSSLKAAEGITFGRDSYWSSSQSYDYSYHSHDYDNWACEVDFFSGVASGDGKEYGGYVCCLRAF